MFPEEPGNETRRPKGNVDGARFRLRRVAPPGSAGSAGDAGESVPEVDAAVRAAIREGGGRITYARFLEICLYDPAHGYYASFGPSVADGLKPPATDYFTSVDLHPAFGRLLAREAAVHLERVLASGARRAWLVEAGAGRGLLARDVLQGLALERPDLAARVCYLIVEPNAGWVEVQRRNLLPEFEGAVEWVRSRGTALPLRGVRGVFLSNELFDALPFHVLEEGPPLGEVYVTEQGGSLAEEGGPLSDPRLAPGDGGGAFALSPGQRLEVSPSAAAMAESTAAALTLGGIIAVDYGDEALALYDAKKRPEGTMRCFFRHRLNDEPLRRLGRQDITAHVDFSGLARAFERGGAKVRRLETQRDFLHRHGLDAVLAKLEADRGELPREVYVRHRRALEALADPKGLGRNVVLTAWR